MFQQVEQPDWQATGAMKVASRNHGIWRSIMYIETKLLNYLLQSEHWQKHAHASLPGSSHHVYISNSWNQHFTMRVSITDQTIATHVWINPQPWMGQLFSKRIRLEDISSDDTVIVCVLTIWLKQLSSRACMFNHQRYRAIWSREELREPTPWYRRID